MEIIFDIDLEFLFNPNYDYSWNTQIHSKV